MVTPELVSVVIVGVGLGLAELRRRRKESEVATKVVAAAAGVESKTDSQTSLLEQIKRDVQDARADVRLNTQAVGRLDDRLTSGQTELSARVDDLADGLRATDLTVRDQGAALAVVASKVALLQQAGAMRSTDAPAITPQRAAGGDGEGRKD